MEQKPQITMPFFESGFFQGKFDFDKDNLTFWTKLAIYVSEWRCFSEEQSVCG